jgi:hypothetical protein
VCGEIIDYLYILFKIISVLTSFPELICRKNLKNNRIRPTLAGYPISGLTGYLTVKSGIRPDIGYKKGRIIRPAGYPEHPYTGTVYQYVSEIIVTISVLTSFPELICRQNLKNNRIRPTLAGYPISGLTGYLTVKYGLSGRPDIRCIPVHQYRYVSEIIVIPPPPLLNLKG